MNHCTVCGPNGPEPRLASDHPDIAKPLHHVWCKRCHATTSRFDSSQGAIDAWNAGQVSRPAWAVKELPDPRKCFWPNERNCHPCFCGKSSHPEAHEPALSRGISLDDAVVHYDNGVANPP